MPRGGRDSNSAGIDPSWRVDRGGKGGMKKGLWNGIRGESGDKSKKDKATSEKHKGDQKKGGSGRGEESRIR